RDLDVDGGGLSLQRGLQRRSQVGVGGHEDPHVIRPSDREPDKVDPECDVNTLLLRSLLRPSGGIAEWSPDDGHPRVAGPHRSLALVRGVRLRFPGGVRKAAVDPDLKERRGATATANDQLTESPWIDLSLGGAIWVDVEALTCRHEDVLV